MSIGTGRPTRRHDQKEPSGLIPLFAVLILIILGSLAWGITHQPPTEAELRPAAKITHDSLAPTYTYDGEIIRWYVFIDPESSVQYLVNDRGGCTPRLDQYGNIVGVQYWNEE